MWFLGSFPQKNQRMYLIFVFFSIHFLNLCLQRNAKTDLDKSNSVGKECHFLSLQQTCFIKTTKLYIMDSKII